MNIINLTSSDLARVEACSEFCAALAELGQQSLNTLTPDKFIPNSPQEQDSVQLKQHKDDSLCQFYIQKVWKTIIDRVVAIMDATFAVHVLLKGVPNGKESRTGLSSVILARSTLDMALSAAYHLDGDFDERFMKACASVMAEARQNQLAMESLDPTASHLVSHQNKTEYKAARAEAIRQGYELDEKGEVKIFECPKVVGICKKSSEGGVEKKVTLEPNTLELAKKYGSPWASFSWRLGSGVTHGRIWSIAAVQESLEAGDSGGLPYLMATTIVREAVYILANSLATYTLQRNHLIQFDDIAFRFHQQLAGWFPDSDNNE
ncbi:hypothetical protein [Propionibacterium australiense]|uniref:Uncharacterized protein n=1 Tax=Propionibacterium australiense TaxID=119981 RepID=A0A383SA20_9ACTN|nr:hypothetical protein [Propionibacterium australiense]SYZ34653.1 Hypothetical protein PROPAUS_2692 [Propionibacterium australiense]VEH89969.1 Uncharacterised protein [Propionibacterium australiense]